MNNLLTAKPTAFNITSPFPHEAVGICTSYIKGHKRPLLSVVFLCSSKIINKGLFPVLSFMVGCVRRLRSAVPLYGSANLIQSASNDFALKRGGLKSYKGETAMRNYNQKLTYHVSYQSLFSLALKANKTESKREEWWQQYIDKRNGKREAPRQQGNDYKSKSILSLAGVDS